MLVPLDPDKPRVNVIDLIAWVGLPVVIVCRPNLGTLNHTAMTAALLKHRKGVKVAGLVINGYDADAAAEDPSIESNRRWLSKMTGPARARRAAQGPRGAGAASRKACSTKR